MSEGWHERIERLVLTPAMKPRLSMITPGVRGFESFALAHNVSSEREVEDVVAQAVGAGATLVRKPRKTSWGGYSGYFKDPEGHLGQSPYLPPYHDMDIAPYVC